jgi:hypothetical protein
VTTSVLALGPTLTPVSSSGAGARVGEELTSGGRVGRAVHGGTLRVPRHSSARGGHRRRYLCVVSMELTPAAGDRRLDLLSDFEKEGHAEQDATRSRRPGAVLGGPWRGRRWMGGAGR